MTQRASGPDPGSLNFDLVVLLIDLHARLARLEASPCATYDEEEVRSAVDDALTAVHLARLASEVGGVGGPSGPSQAPTPCAAAAARKSARRVCPEQA